MATDNENSGKGSPPRGNGTHNEEIKKPKPHIPRELQTFFTHGLAAAEAEAQMEHAKWKSTKVLDDLVGADTDKMAKRFCVAEVAAYHQAVKDAEDKPNAEALKALAWKMGLSALSRTVPNVSREKLAELLNHRPEELCEPG